MEQSKSSNTKTVINVVLILLLLWLIFTPAIAYSVMSIKFDLIHTLKESLKTHGPMIALFLLNYLFLCPRCLFTKGRKKWFYIVNLVLILGWRAAVIIKSLNDDVPQAVIDAFADVNMTYAMIFGNFLIMLFDIMIVVFAA